MSVRNRGSLASYNSGRSRAMGVVRGAFILLLLALLSFAFGFFVVARVMPGEKAPQIPGNSARSVSPSGNEGRTTESNPAPRPSTSAQNRSNPSSGQPGPTIDPEEKPEVQTPDSLDSTHNTPSPSDTNTGAPGVGSATGTQSPERDTFGAVSSDPQDRENTDQRTSRRRQRDREVTQAPETPDERHSGSTSRTEPSPREGTREEATTEPTNGSGLYRVQSGVYSTREAAEREAGRLNEQGLSASVRAMTAEGRTLYRVQHGAYRNRANAETAQAKLKSAGVDSTISQSD